MRYLPVVTQFTYPTYPRFVFVAVPSPFDYLPSSLFVSVGYAGWFYLPQFGFLPSSHFPVLPTWFPSRSFPAPPTCRCPACRSDLAPTQFDQFLPPAQPFAFAHLVCRICLPHVLLRTHLPPAPHTHTHTFTFGSRSFVVPSFYPTPGWFTVPVFTPHRSPGSFPRTHAHRAPHAHVCLLLLHVPTCLYPVLPPTPPTLPLPLPQFARSTCRFRAHTPRFAHPFPPYLPLPVPLYLPLPTLPSSHAFTLHSTLRWTLPHRFCPSGLVEFVLPSSHGSVPFPSYVRSTGYPVCIAFVPVPSSAPAVPCRYRTLLR